LKGSSEINQEIKNEIITNNELKLKEFSPSQDFNLKMNSPVKIIKMKESIDLKENNPKLKEEIFFKNPVQPLVHKEKHFIDKEYDKLKDVQFENAFGKVKSIPKEKIDNIR